MKNAASMRTIVSAGPVAVLVISGVTGVFGVVGFVGVVGATTGAERVYATHS